MDLLYASYAWEEEQTNKQTYPNYMDLLLINVGIVVVVVLVDYRSNGFKAHVESFWS